MANLIDTDFFIGMLDLPARTNAGAMSAMTDSFIPQYERKFLQACFGYEMYKDFEAERAAQETAGEGIYYDLIHGKEYTNEDRRLCKWEGLVPDDASVLSPIACFVYFYYRQSTTTRTDAVGENKPGAQNAEVVSAAAKMCDAWNEMSRSAESLYDFLYNNADSYPLWDACYFEGYLLEKINVFGI